MSSYRIIIVILVCLKILSYLFLNTARTTNENLEAFIDHDIHADRQNELIKGLQNTLRMKLKIKKTLSPLESLIDSITTLRDSKNSVLDNYLKLFNSPEVRSITTRELAYTYNDGIDSLINCHQLQINGFSLLNDCIDSILQIDNQPDYAIPIILELEKRKDSMDLFLTYVYTYNNMDTNWSYSINNKNVPFYRFPINIGSVTGDFSICHKKQDSNSDRVCFRSTFQ